MRADEGTRGRLKELAEQVIRAGRPAPRRGASAPFEGLSAMGDRGQLLVVLPASRIVAVRQPRSPAAPPFETDGLGEFPRMVRDLAGPPRPAGE